MMPTWPRRCALALLLAPAVVLGQGREGGPTFRSGVQSIDVDVLVTDKSGKAVRGLTKEDFILSEDDAPQQITTFTFVDFPIIPAATRKAAIAAVEPDVVTNTGNGRMYVMVLTRRNQRSRLIARRFVEESVDPDDQVAVIQLCGGMSSAQAFTPNRQLMLAAIDRVLIGADGDGDDSGVDARSVICDERQFEIIEEMAERLGLVTARRKVVVWFDPRSVFNPTGPKAAEERFAQRDDYSAPLVMSGVLLASQQKSAHHTLLTDPRLTSILGSAPTSVRRFGRRDVVSVFGEIYSNLPQSDPVRVNVSVSTAKGKKAVTIDASLLPGEEPGRTAYVARIPLADLNAGDYVLTLEARAGRAKEMRHVPFTVLVE